MSDKSDSKTTMPEVKFGVDMSTGTPAIVVESVKGTDLKRPVAEPQLEGKCVPLRWQNGIEFRHVVAHSEAPKSFHDGHPRARHGCDVKSLISLGVVVVKVQTRRTQVHLHRLVDSTELGSQNAVDTRRQAAFVNRQGLVEIKVLFQLFLGEIVWEEVEPLQNVGLLDVA